MPRIFDREMFDCYITVLETVDPEQAATIEAAYEHTTDSEEEIAELLIEALHEHDLAPEVWTDYNNEDLTPIRMLGIKDLASGETKGV